MSATSVRRSIHLVGSVGMNVGQRIGSLQRTWGAHLFSLSSLAVHTGSAYLHYALHSTGQLFLLMVVIAVFLA
jgi:hypothetical protein